MSSKDFPKVEKSNKKPEIKLTDEINVDVVRDMGQLPRPSSVKRSILTPKDQAQLHFNNQNQVDQSDFTFAENKEQ